jgi:hypothetical protein
MAKSKSSTFYQIHYRNPQDGSTVSLKARKIQDSSLGLSFVAISDFIFDTSGILVNPNEEARKIEFENIKTLHLSIYSIQSIAEVGEHNKSLKFKNDKSNLFVLTTEPPGPSSN